MTGLEIMQSYSVEPWPDGSYAVADGGGCPWHYAQTRWEAVMWLAEFADRLSDDRATDSQPTSPKDEEPQPHAEQLTLL